MEYINDYVTNIIYEENNKNDNWGNIVVFIDIEGNLTTDVFLEYLNYLVENNDILHQNIIKRNNKNYLEFNKIDIHKHYLIKNCIESLWLSYKNIYLFPLMFFDGYHMIEDIKQEVEYQKRNNDIPQA